MQKKTINLALGLAFGLVAVNAQAALTLTFTNSAAATAVAGPCSSSSWAAGSEYRMCSPATNTIGGGGEKNSIFGGETYSFNDAGAMTGVTGTPTNPGTGGGGAAPTAGTNPTTQQSASFFGPSFNFLAPTVGSLAGTAYGVGTTSLNAATTPVNGAATMMHFNVLEAQWGGTYFPLGSVGGGINFTGVISGASTVGNVTTFTFDLFANHTIAPSEDPGAAGFAGWDAQWHMQGTGVHTAVPVPAAVWLLGSGLMGLVGVARRKKA